MKIEQEIIGNGSLITVTNRLGLKVTLSSLGAGLHGVEYLGKPMVAAPKDIDEYLNSSCYYGKIVGPYGSRIRDGLVNVGDKMVQLDRNENGNCNHSGSIGFSFQDFETKINHDPNGNFVDIIFSLKKEASSDYPADIEILVSYSIREDTPEIVLTVDCTSSEETPLNIVSHPYFNLGEKDLHSLKLTVPASFVATYDKTQMITGVEKVDVITDFRDGCPIMRHVDDPTLMNAPMIGYDHCYRLDEGDSPIILESDEVALFVHTTLPGVVIYSNNFAKEGVLMNNGEREFRRSSLAIEPCAVYSSGLDVESGKRQWFQTTFSFFDKQAIEKSNDASLAVGCLVHYAHEKGLIHDSDVRFYENMLCNELRIPLPFAMENCPISYCLDDIPTPDVFLSPIRSRLSEIGYEEGEASRYLCHLLGLLCPRPSLVEATFDENLEKGDPEGATEYLFGVSVASGYVEKNKVDHNIVFDARFDDGPELEVSINLSKPEKNNKDIAKLVGAKKSGYPACVLCYDNIGFGGSPTHPARGNIRFVPVLLDGTDWYLQFSPYGYFKRHCIIFSKEHVPMAINEHIFRSLLDFVDLFPHYFVGSNADLPIVGGSILNHEHFQGGEAKLPLLRAPMKERIPLEKKGVRLYIVDFYNTALLIQSEDKDALLELAERIRFTWRHYDDKENDILSQTDGHPHNTTTPIARKEGNLYSLYLILRNNRCDKKYPDGIVHAHPEFAHIKQEGIGLIEASGLFVLPARLVRQSKILEEAVSNGVEFAQVAASHPDMEGFLDMYKALKKGVSKEAYMGEVCRGILNNVAVFKKDEKGNRGLKAFLKEVLQ